MKLFLFFFYLISCTSTGEIKKSGTPLSPPTRQENLEKFLSLSASTINLSKAREAVAEVQKIEVFPELSLFINEYEKVMGSEARNPYLWKWLTKIVRVIQLSSISSDFEKEAQKAQLYLLMYVVVMDDVVDVMRNKNLFQSIKLIASNADYLKNQSAFTEHEKHILLFMTKLWKAYQAIITKLPLYNHLGDFLSFDFMQVINACEYDLLMSYNMNYINPIEFGNYHPHNMAMVCLTMINLLASPSLNLNEIGKIREILILGQKMGRICNSVSTWKREIPKGDFSSEVTIMAFLNGVLTTDDLKKDTHYIISKIEESKTVENLLQEWRNFETSTLKLSQSVYSIDMRAYILSLTRVLELQVGSMGLQ